MKEKIHSPESLKKELDKQRFVKKKIVFTNGCFDLLHIGHVRYLLKAKACGDLLVVGLNSDVSVQIIKGQKRPIVPEMQRAEVLAALGCVNYVALFDDPDPLTLIRLLKPDVLVKGADWEENKIVGAEMVRKNGGEVVRIEFVPGASTTEIIRKILSVHGRKMQNNDR